MVKVSKEGFENFENFQKIEDSENFEDLKEGQTTLIEGQGGVSRRRDRRGARVKHLNKDKEELFDAIDINKSGWISSSELTNYIAWRFNVPDDGMSELEENLADFLPTLYGGQPVSRKAFITARVEKGQVNADMVFAWTANAPPPPRATKATAAARGGGGGGGEEAAIMTKLKRSEKKVEELRKATQKQADYAVSIVKSLQDNLRDNLPRIGNQLLTSVENASRSADNASKSAENASTSARKASISEEKALKSDDYIESIGVKADKTLSQIENDLSEANVIVNDISEQKKTADKIGKETKKKLIDADADIVQQDTNLISAAGVQQPFENIYEGFDVNSARGNVIRQQENKLGEIAAKTHNIGGEIMLDYLIDSEDTVNTSYTDSFDKKKQKNRNLLRESQLKEYNANIISEYINVLKVIIVSILLCIIFIFLNMKGIIKNNFKTIIIYIIILLNVIYVITRIYWLSYRDTIVFDKSLTDHDRNYIHDISNNLYSEKDFNLGLISGTCIGSGCCGVGMIYDSTVNKCISNNLMGFENMNSGLIEPLEYKNYASNIF